MNLQNLRKTVLTYYARHGRNDLPWRKTRDPYRILVSEIMLQQTQVSRVRATYAEFLATFPTVRDLAEASTGDLLKAWQGLGYNRRALNLKRAAEVIMRDHGGRFPRSAEALEALPGIGQSTRGAVMAFAFGIPTAFIETNIRSVFIHHLFKGAREVHDRDILPLIEEALNRKDPRSWYYALMDYGVHLKATHPNPSRRSRHHVRQSPFKGSNRELRSEILKTVLEKPVVESALVRRFAKLGKDTDRVKAAILALEKEGFLVRERDILKVTY